jgi:hypothetical protein
MELMLRLGCLAYPNGKSALFSSNFPLHMKDKTQVSMAPLVK